MPKITQPASDTGTWNQDDFLMGLVCVSPQARLAQTAPGPGETLFPSQLPARQALPHLPSAHRSSTEVKLRLQEFLLSKSKEPTPGGLNHSLPQHPKCWYDP